MDFSKIFLKDARPTKIGGQAVIDGVMMKGDTHTAVAIRLPDDRIYLKTILNGKRPRWMKLPLIRGVVSFVASLVSGMKVLTFSADVQEYFLGEEVSEEPGKILLCRWFFRLRFQFWCLPCCRRRSWEH